MPVKNTQTAATRREFVRLTATGLGLAAWQGLGLPRSTQLAAAPDPLARARESLRAIILEHARAKDNPWLLFHGTRALGPGFPAGETSAVEHLCTRYLLEKTVNGKVYLYMPLSDEGHLNAFLSEGALDAGVTPAYSFRRNGRRHTLADLIAGAKATFAFDPASVDRDALAWSLIVFARTTEPLQDRWVNAYGRPIRFSEVVDLAMATLDDSTQQLRAAMRRGTTTPEVDKIHNFACAGTHLIYGLTTCLRFGHRPRALAERMKVQFDLLVWRLAADSQLVDRYYQQVAGQYPQDLARIYRLDAKLKFLGHAFEVLSYARLFRLFSPTPGQEESIRRGQQELTEVVEAIEREKVRRFAGDRKLFNLIMGDLCHAYHGLAMTRGVNQA